MGGAGQSFGRASRLVSRFLGRPAVVPLVGRSVFWSVRSLVSPAPPSRPPSVPPSLSPSILRLASPHPSADADGDGTIDFAEMEAAVRTHQKVDVSQWLRRERRIGIQHEEQQRQVHAGQTSMARRRFAFDAPCGPRCLSFDAELWICDGSDMVQIWFKALCGP